MQLREDINKLFDFPVESKYCFKAVVWFYNQDTAKSWHIKGTISYMFPKESYYNYEIINYLKYKEICNIGLCNHLLYAICTLYLNTLNNSKQKILVRCVLDTLKSQLERECDIKISNNDYLKYLYITD